MFFFETLSTCYGIKTLLFSHLCSILRLGVRHDADWIVSNSLFPLSISFDLYPEIGDANFKCSLWTFKQQLA